MATHDSAAIPDCRRSGFAALPIRHGLYHDLVTYNSSHAGVIERSVLHMLLGAGDDRAQAAWMPAPDMLAASLGLPPHALPGPDARMFVEQAVLAVRRDLTFTVW